MNVSAMALSLCDESSGNGCFTPALPTRLPTAVLALCTPALPTQQSANSGARIVPNALDPRFPQVLCRQPHCVHLNPWAFERKTE